ncbi:MAG: chorismate-binding protein, partial [Nitrosospira sp.]|nr:chorismate-binding protein [Nitrosospira sp.]
MTETEFDDLAAQGYNRIPVVLETFADLDTPLSVYLKLANRPYSYLLESVQGGERFGRYSFIGLPATTRIEARGNRVRIIDGSGSQEIDADDPLAFVESYLSRFHVAPYPGLPRFCGGLAGYFSYDAVRYIERKLAGHARFDTLDTPDILLLLSEELAVVDNLSGKLYLIVYAAPGAAGAAKAYECAKIRLKDLLANLRKPVAIPLEAPRNPGEAVSEFSEGDFIQAVERAKRYIFDGDIMQVVLSQRTVKPYGASPLALYRALRGLNPSPYMFYYDFGDFHLTGASPEILVRLEGGTVTVRPIAGTRPRGKTVQEDATLAADLLSDPKERAEHVMLMDLGRNDVGRVAQTGTVSVTENMQIEHYSHVMHIVSNV